MITKIRSSNIATRNKPPLVKYFMSILRTPKFVTLIREISFERILFRLIKVEAKKVWYTYFIDLNSGLLSKLLLWSSYLQHNGNILSVQRKSKPKTKFHKCFDRKYRWIYFCRARIFQFLRMILFYFAWCCTWLAIKE